MVLSPESLEIRSLLSASGFVEGQVLVGLDLSEDPAAIENLYPGSEMTPLGDYGVFLLDLPAEFDSSEATTTVVSQLSAVSGIRYAMPNLLIQPSAVPNDPDFGRLWGLRNTGQNVNGVTGTPGVDIDAVPAWDVSTGSTSTLVAIIDTGVDYNHPDLQANMWVNPGEIPGNGIDDDGNGFVDDVHGYDFYDNDGDPMDTGGHGTHVAGTVGAVGNNGVGITGVSWGVRMMALRFLGPFGGFTSDAVRSVNYAVQMGAVISNNSWGGGGRNQALEDAIINARNQGHIFVAAAGNSASDNDRFPSYPSGYPQDNVVSVAATDQNDNLAGFSNFGATTVDIGAPGVNIWSTTPVNGSFSYQPNYDFSNGTSMAAPHVTGALAVMRSIAPNLPYTELIDALYQGAEPVPALNGRVATGARLNLANAIAEMRAAVIDASTDSVAENAGPGAVTLTIRKVATDVNSSLELDLFFDDPSEVAVPALAGGSRIVIPAGQEQVEIPVDILDDAILDGTQIVTFDLRHNNVSIGTFELHVTDHELLNVNIHAASVGENAGANAASITVTRPNTDIFPSNNFVLIENQIREFDAVGTVVRTIPVEWPGGGVRPVEDNARDLVVLSGGNIAVFNGTGNTSLSVYRAGTGQWSHIPVSGLSAALNDNATGGIAAVDDWVFLADVGFTNANRGIVRVNVLTGDTRRFSTQFSYRDVSVGLNGLIYGLDANGTALREFDAAKLTLKRMITLPAPVNTIAVDEDGTIFAGDSAGNVRVLDPEGVPVNSVSAAATGVNDIELNRQGRILLGTAGGQAVESTRDLAAFSAWDFLPNDAFVAFGDNPHYSIRDLYVTLTSSDTTELQVPLQVTIPAGQMSVTFTVDAVDDNLRDGTQTVTVSAAAPGFITGSDTVDVLDAEAILIDVLATAVPENAGPGATQVRVHRTDTDGPFDFVTTQTFGVDTPQAIPDRDTIISSVLVPAQLSQVTDVDVTINIQHSWLADLDVFLRGPAGQRVELFTDLISNGSAFTGTILDDEASTSILDGAAPYTGRFRPEGSLDIFDGLNPAGFWTLEVTDDNNFDTGTLLSWTLTLTTAGLAPVTVTLASSDTTEATVPLQVLIPANQSEVVVPLNAIDDTILDGTRRVTISATSSSFPALALGSDTVDVTDHELLALTLHAASISEAAGANAATGRVTRHNTNRSVPLTVVLSSSDTTELTVPATVVIPAGAAFVDFPINAVDDALADGSQLVTITASHAGYSNAPAASITVTDLEPALVLNTPTLSVAENAGSVQITVTRQDVTNLSQPLTVTLSSSDTSELTVPTSVVIPVGQASVTFSASVVDDTLLDGPQPVTVTATATGIVAGQLPMTVNDHETLTLTVNRPAVIENAGAAAATGTVIRGNTNLAAALVVTLTSSDLTELRVPATVTIPAGQASATFSINAVNDLILDGTQLVTLTASAANYTAATVQVAVDDHEPPVITLPAAVTALPRPVIQWNAIPGAARYEIWLNNLSTGQQVARTDQLTTSQYTPTHDLAIGRYALWVRAYDAQGQSSVWSNTYRFRVDTPPMITAPSGTPGEMAPATFPLISWTAVAGADHYDVWVDNLTTGQSQVIRQPVVNGTSFQSLVSPGSGTYKAWVRAFNGTNETSRWSSPRTFVVLAAPAVVSPAGDTFDTTPTFAWTPISGATHYELQVRSLENNATALRDQHVTATSLTAQFDLAAGQYGVWVRAFSNSTFSAWSQQQNFGIAQPPRVTSPTGTVPGGSLPQFTWTALDQTARYELWVSQDFAGGSSQRVIYETSLTTNSFTPTTPLGRGNYRVWVRAISTMGVTTGWSAAESFTVGPVASLAPHASPGDLRPELQLTLFHDRVQNSATPSRPEQSTETAADSSARQTLAETRSNGSRARKTAPHVAVDSPASRMSDRDLRSDGSHPASADTQPADQSAEAALHDTVMAAWAAEEWWIRN